MEMNQNYSFSMVEGLFQLSLTGLSLDNSTDETNVTVYVQPFDNWFNKTIVPTLFGLIAFIGLIGNALVVTVIVSQPKMRTRMNILLLNLAFSDITFLILCVPFMAYRYAADTWNIGELMCKLSEYLIYVTMYVTMYTLVLISVVRYLIVVYTTQSAPYTSKVKLFMMTIGIWMINLISNIHIYINYKVKTYKAIGSPPYRYCGIESVETGKTFFIVFFMFSYVLPFCLISLFYMLLLRHVRLTRESSSLRQLSDKASSESRPPRHTQNASRILLRVVAVLALSWLPLHLHFLLAYFGYQPKSHAYMIYRVFCYCLAYSNSCMNPFIYSFVSADFRSSFQKILFLCCKRSNASGTQNGRPPIPLNDMAS